MWSRKPLYSGAPCPHCGEPLAHYGRIRTFFTRPPFLKCPECNFVAWKRPPGTLPATLRILGTAADTVRRPLVLASVIMAGAAAFLSSTVDWNSTAAKASQAASFLMDALVHPNSAVVDRVLNPEMIAIADVRSPVLTFATGPLKAARISNPRAESRPSPPPPKDNVRRVRNGNRVVVERQKTRDRIPRLNPSPDSGRVAAR